MKSYQDLKRNLVRNITNGLVGLVIAGCAQNQSSSNLPEQPTPRAERYTFSNFTKYHDSGIDYRTGGICSGDFDSDGDIDLAIVTSEQILLYENTMPQKNRPDTTLKRRMMKDDEIPIPDLR